MQAPLTHQLDNLEQTIEEISGRLDESNRLLAKPDTDRNGTDIAALNRDYNELKKSLEKHNSEWEQTATNWKRWRNRFGERKRSKTDGT